MSETTQLQFISHRPVVCVGVWCGYAMWCVVCVMCGVWCGGHTLQHTVPHMSHTPQKNHENKISKNLMRHPLET